MEQFRIQKSQYPNHIPVRADLLSHVMRRNKGEITMKKIVSLAAVTTMAAVCALPTFAYTNSTEAVNETQNISANETAQTSVYAEVGSTFTVTIPKKITLSGETKSGAYFISCTGNIKDTRYISVVPDSSFTMTQKGKADITATTLQQITKFRSADYTGFLEADETEMGTDIEGVIEASSLSAGSWNGVFNFKINLI